MINLTKKIGVFAGLLLLLCAPRWAAAQIQRDTTHWNDEELYQDEDKSAPSFFSVGGGILGAYFIPNLSSFNTNVAQPFVGKNYRNEVWMIGGQGFITLPWVKNLRIGGMGYSGTSVDCGCSNDTITQNSTPVDRYLTYEVGYAALTIDYVLPLRINHFHIVPGIALGYGAVNIYARQAANRIDFNIGDEFGGGSPDNVYTTHTYSSSFFLYMPQLQFEYSPLGYLMFRLTAAYQGTSMGTWTVDQGVSLGNSSGLSGINGSGLVLSLGAFFGLFQ
jgi:hypothetical protein